MIITQPFRNNRKLVASRVTNEKLASRHPFILSGNDQQSICRNAAQLLDWTLKHPQDSISNIAFNNNRKNNPRLDFASVFDVNSLTMLREQLQGIVAEATLPYSTRSDRPVILCFGGQISTSVSINRAVYDNFSVYRNNLGACDLAIKSMGLRSIFPDVFSDIAESDPVYLQMKLFAIQYASAKSWIDCGLNVVVAVGHSFGELTALCITGILTLEDTITVISRRAKIVKEYWGDEKGAMLAVEASMQKVHSLLETTAAILKEQNESVPTVACYNGPTSFTIAGSTKAIDVLEATVSKISLKIRTKRLNVTDAFHSTLVSPLRPKLLNLGKDVTFREPRIPLMHSTESHLTSPNESFIADHLGNPV